MRSFLLLLAAVLAAALTAAGQTQPGPALTVDASAARHAISPDIYGMNWYWGQEDRTAGDYDVKAATVDAELRPGVRRWGGNNTSRYHWQLDVSNIDADWFFEVLPDNTHYDASKLPEGSSFNVFLERTRVTGGKVLGTIPVLGWLPKARERMCSFDVAKYGAQCKVDQWFPSCGNGVVYDPACGDPTDLEHNPGPSNPVYVKNYPTDDNQQTKEDLQIEWVKYIVGKYGRSNQGGVAIWSLDNEPIWWDSTHRDIHPLPYSYDELANLNLTYAAAVKQADPTALVSGPVGDNWASLWFSKKDIVAGWNSGGSWWGNPVDRNAHGGVPLLAWYLQQFQNYDQQHRVRLLDYLDLHAYIHPAAVQTEDSSGHSVETDATRQLRFDATREFWDPTYVVSGDYWIVDTDNHGSPVAPRLIPRLREIVEQNYPETKIAITEYNYHALDHINGAVAQGELFGIFGREGLDAATLWGAPNPTDPGAFAWRIYRNYDGIGGAFGETSVAATSADQGKLSIYAAQRSDTALTLMVMNKTGGDLTSTVAISNFTPAAKAQVYRYSAANLSAIVQGDDLQLNGSSFTATFPAVSMTLIVVPASPDALPVPKPVVNAVTNAASYGTAIAPGQMVVVWGLNLGPDQLQNVITAGPNMVVGTEMAGVRVLFDGVPGPMVHALKTQVSAVAPYFGASKATTHVQVEYQGVRSDPLEAPVSAAGPGLFTVDFSGKGQGAITNNYDDKSTAPNSAQKPAAPGSVVTLWVTGEGVTDPPGVDGRLAIEILPKPVLPVSVEIGGYAAEVQYAGAAPWNMPGLMQVNAKIDARATPGDATPVHVTVGQAKSQDGVTMVVR